MSFNIEFIHAIIEQAKHLLNEFGEFYPFGYILDINKNSRLVTVYTGDDFPASINLIKDLVHTLKAEIDDEKCISIGICDDVLVSNKNIADDEFNAIQIRLKNKDGKKIDLFIPYRFVEDSYYYCDAYESIGTFD